MERKFKINVELDLVLERLTEVKPDLIWKAWTEPKHLMPWFCPRPWKVTECEIDLRVGGKFLTVMEGPNGEKFPNVGCYLEVLDKKRLIWTSVLKDDFRPLPESQNGAGMPFTAIITLEANKGGTKYTAHVMHANVEGKKQHEQMGFHHGWGIAFDQLVEYVKNNLA